MAWKADPKKELRLAANGEKGSYQATLAALPEILSSLMHAHPQNGLSHEKGRSNLSARKLKSKKTPQGA